jgi:hypothetical protein
MRTPDQLRRRSRDLSREGFRIAAHCRTQAAGRQQSGAEVVATSCPACTDSTAHGVAGRSESNTWPTHSDLTTPQTDRRVEAGMSCPSSWSVGLSYLSGLSRLSGLGKAPTS